MSAMLPIQIVEDGCGKAELEVGNAMPCAALSQVVGHVSCITVDKRLRIVGGARFDHLNEIVHRLWPGSKTAVAQDVYGGLFVLPGEDFPGDPGRLWYYAPDTLSWEMLEMGYPAFLAWACTEGPRRFYATFSWDDEDDVLDRIAVEQGMLFYPFPWTAQFDAASASKKVIPLDELIALHADIQRQLDEVS